MTDAPWHGLNGLVAYLNDRVAAVRQESAVRFAWKTSDVAEELADMRVMLTMLRDAVQERNGVICEICSMAHDSNEDLDWVLGAVPKEGEGT